MATFPRRGEVWLAQLPDDPKLRPVLVISPDIRNELSNSVIVVPITTNLRPLRTHIFLPAGQGGLTSDSMARCENLSYLGKARLVRGPVGKSISDALLGEVERALLIALGISI